jgi:hypothetical protein
VALEDRGLRNLCAPLPFLGAATFNEARSQARRGIWVVKERRMHSELQRADDKARIRVGLANSGTEARAIRVKEISQQLPCQML